MKGGELNFFYILLTNIILGYEAFGNSHFNSLTMNFIKIINNLTEIAKYFIKTELPVMQCPAFLLPRQLRAEPVNCNPSCTKCLVENSHLLAVLAQPKGGIRPTGTSIRVTSPVGLHSPMNTY
jgi:hypothetical protein